MNEASMLRYQLQNNTQKNRYTIRVTPYFLSENKLNNSKKKRRVAPTFYCVVS